MYFNGVGPQYRKRCIEEYPSDDIGVDPSDEKTQALYRGTVDLSRSTALPYN